MGNGYKFVVLMVNRRGRDWMAHISRRRILIHVRRHPMRTSQG